MAFNGAPYVIQPPMIVSLRKSAEKIVSRHVRTDTRQTSSRSLQVISLIQ